MTSFYYRSAWEASLSLLFKLMPKISIGRICSFMFFPFVIVQISFADGARAFPVSYEGENIFSLALDLPKYPAKMRAEEATKLLAHAIESKGIDVLLPLVTVDLNEDHFLLYVRGVLITSLYRGDINARDQQEFLEYADLVHARLKKLVEQELERQAWQSIALKLFISVILIILGFYVMRQLKIAFDRLEIILVERQDLVRKLGIFGMPLFKRESVAGMLAFLSSIFRWLAYLAVFAIIMISLLGQFDVTKGFLKSLGRATLLDLAQALQKVSAAIPGLILGFLILLSLHIAVHAFNLMLDGLKSQRIKGRLIPAHRIPVLKTVAPAILFAIFVPLAVAALFQRWNTPTQWLVVGASLVVMLGALPLIATWLCGSLILWRNELVLGAWISINGVVGEISSINTIFLHLVPLGGGTVAFPMLKVFFSSIKKYATPPQETFEFELKAPQQIDSYIKKLCESLSGIAEDLSIIPIAIQRGSVLCRASFPISSTDAKAKVIMGILRFSDVADELDSKGQSSE